MSSLKKHKAKRISAGHYIYRGFDVQCLGYYNPEQHVVWEASDERGSGFAHGFSLAETKMWIDAELDGYNKEKVQ